MQQLQAPREPCHVRLLRYKAQWDARQLEKARQLEEMAAVQGIDNNHPTYSPMIQSSSLSSPQQSPTTNITPAVNNYTPLKPTRSQQREYERQHLDKLINERYEEMKKAAKDIGATLTNDKDAFDYLKRTIVGVDPGGCFTVFKDDKVSYLGLGSFGKLKSIEKSRQKVQKMRDDKVNEVINAVPPGNESPQDKVHRLEKEYSRLIAGILPSFSPPPPPPPPTAQESRTTSSSPTPMDLDDSSDSASMDLDALQPNTSTTTPPHTDKQIADLCDAKRKELHAARKEMQKLKANTLKTNNECKKLDLVLVKLQLKFNRKVDALGAMLKNYVLSQLGCIFITPAFNANNDLVSGNSRLSNINKLIFQRMGYMGILKSIKEGQAMAGAGITLIVSEMYSTRKCSCCGTMNNQVGIKKIYQCSNQNCRVILCRDENGVRNIIMDAILRIVFEFQPSNRARVRFKRAEDHVCNGFRINS